MSQTHCVVNCINKDKTSRFKNSNTVTCSNIIGVVQTKIHSLRIQASYVLLAQNLSFKLI